MPFFRYRKLRRRPRCAPVDVLEPRRLLSATASPLSLVGSDSGVVNVPYSLQINFHDTANDVPSSYSIDWGDDTSQVVNPAADPSGGYTHLYQFGNNWQISVTAQSPSGAFSASQDVTVQEAVDNLTSTAVSTHEIDLAWTLYANNAISIEVDRSLDGNTFKAIKQLPGNATSFADKHLKHSINYYYQIRAIQPAGPSNYTDVADDSTLDPTPTGLTGRTNGPYEIDLHWTNHAGPDAMNVLERSDDGGATFFAVNYHEATGESKFVDTVGSENFSEYRVASNSSAYSKIFKITSVLCAPYSASSSIVNGMVTLTWQPPSDTGPDEFNPTYYVPTSHAVTYDVYRQNSGTKQWMKLTPTSVSATTFSDSSAPPGISHYRITTVDAAGHESPPISVSTPGEVGTYDSASGTWHIDANNNHQWDGNAGDATYEFGSPGTIAVTGNWTGRSTTNQIGVFNPATGVWQLDRNGNHHFDAHGDLTFTFGKPGDLPVVGSWNGKPRTEVGVFDPSSMTFQLDKNGNGKWDGPDKDILIQLSTVHGVPHSPNDSYSAFGSASALGTQLALVDSTTHTLYPLGTDGTAGQSTIFNPVAIPFADDLDGDGSQEIALFEATTQEIALNSDFTAPFRFASGGSQAVSI